MDEASYALTFPEVKASRADLLVYFYARALQILRPGGWLAFITSNSFTKRKYGEALRRHLSTQLTIKTVIDFGEIQIFDATVEPYVLVGHKTNPVEDVQVTGHNLYPVLSRQLTGRGSIEQVRNEVQRLSHHLESEVSRFPQARLINSEWRIEDEPLNRLFDRLMSQGTALRTISDGRMYMGIKTGLNQAFVIDTAKRDELIASDPSSRELIEAWVTGKDIARWRITPTDNHVIFANRGIDLKRYPAVWDHLMRFRSALEKRATSHLHPWYELQQPQEGIYHEFAVPKIVWPDIAREIRFAYDTKGSYVANTCYIIPTDSKWLLAVMNSKLAQFLICQLTNSLPGGFSRLFPQHLEHFPVVTPDPQMQASLSSFWEAAANGQVVDQQSVDDSVNQLYGISRTDKALLDNWVSARSLS